MPKRRRMPENIAERFFSKRRRRHSMSPSRERVSEMGYNRQIAMLQLEVDLLRAQIHLLRRQINEIRKEQSSGDKEEKRTCSIM